MNAERRKRRILAGGLAAFAVLILAAVAALSLFDINSYRPDIERAASAATGLDVRVRGKMGLSVFPPGLSARDVQVAGRGGPVLSVERLRIGLELLSLLRGEIRIAGCRLAAPSATVVKDGEGRYNFARIPGMPPAGSPAGAFRLKKLDLSGGSLVYLDRKTGGKLELKGISLAVSDLSLADSGGDFLKGLSFTGTVACREFTRKNLRISDAAGSVKAGQGVFFLDLPTLEIFGSKGRGSVRMDATRSDAEYGISLQAPGLDFEELTGSFGAAKVISGKGDLELSLTVKEKKGRTLADGADGTLSLRGGNLTTHTVDLDKVLSSYAASQQFNLTDAGAFLIAGPLGSAALKAYRFGELYDHARGGSGAIIRLVSRWKITNGVADAGDCALTTRGSRVALKGRLNLATERYEDVTVALLDEKGCARFTQGISGPFGSPRIGAVGALETLAGPILNLYRQAERLVQGGKCEAFYSGSLPHPR
jgi:AsmA protein